MTDEAMTSTIEWVNAKERLPEVEESFFGKLFMVCFKDGDVYPLRYVKKTIRGKLVERWEYWNGNIYYGDVVAWAEMPEPPKGVFF